MVMMVPRWLELVKDFDSEILYYPGKSQRSCRCTESRRTRQIELLEIDGSRVGNRVDEIRD